MRFPALLLATLTCTAASAANLVQNPGFDDDLLHWLPFGSSVIEHGQADERGLPTSGSVAIAQAPAAEGTLIGAAQCIPVVAGVTYAFGASARIPPGSPINAASVGVGWSSSADCSSNDLGGSPIIPSFVRLEGAWGTTQAWGTAPPAAQGALLTLRAGSGSNVFIEVAFDNAFFLADATCGPTLTALCLNEGRFRVIVEWETKAGDEGFGRAVKLTDDSGYFWFFDQANVELVTKLIDACPTQFGTFWFFAAGLTDVETVIRVHDTHADVERAYTNPQETPFAPIQDTDAFETCLALGG